MGGLLALLAVGAFFLFSSGKKKGISGGGASGGNVRTSPFRLVPLGEDDSGATYEVHAKSGAFGPASEFVVLTYRETPDGRRVLLSEESDAPPEVRAQARTEFGLVPIPAAAV